jgi:hypothetical protein
MAAQMDAAAAAHAAPATAETNAEDRRDEADAADHRARFAAIGEDGFDSRTRVSLCFVPAYDLRRQVPSLFLCQAIAVRESHVVYGHRAFGDIEAEQMPYLDAAVLHYAIRFSARLLETGNLIAVTAPVSVETLGWSRGREIYRTALKSAGVLDHPHIIPTLDDVPPGATAGRLAEMIRGLRPYARRIAVMLPDSNVALERSGALGAAGYILPLPRRSEAQAAARAAQWLSRLCGAQNAFSCLLDLNSEEALEAAKGAAIRFGAGSALAPRALIGDSALEYARLLSRTPPLQGAQPA